MQVVFKNNLLVTLKYFSLITIITKFKRNVVDVVWVDNLKKNCNTVGDERAIGRARVMKN